MKILIALMFGVFINTVVPAQKSSYKGLPSLVWPKLYDIEYKKEKDALGEYDQPIFSDAARSLDGKTVTLPGYMVPFESGVKEKHFMLSAMPLNACFFCGVGGPETVVEVFAKSEVTFTEKPVEIRGTLRLNHKDPDKMIYILENAEWLGEVQF